MTQKEKQLLLKDLSGRLPYGVKCKVKYYDDVWNICSINPNGVTFVTKYTGYPIETNWENCKPYLFPLSSMTEEQMNDCPIGETNLNIINSNMGYGIIEIPWQLSHLFVDWCNKNHFDYRGLIPMGLANDASGLNIY